MNIFDITDRRADDIADRPLPMAPVEGFEALELGYEAGKLRWLNARSLLMQRAYEAEIDRVRDLTGEVLPNPAVGQDGQMRRSANKESWDDAIERLKRQNPQAAGELRGKSLIEDEAMTSAHDLEARRVAAGEVADFWGGATLFAGDLGSGILDPINLALLPLGAGTFGARTVAGAIGRAALQESALSAVAEATAQIVNRDFYEEIGLRSNPWADIALAAAGGAVLGGGARAIGEGVKYAFRTRGEPLTGDLPAATRELERQALDEAVGVPSEQLDLGIAEVTAGRSAPVPERVAPAADDGEAVRPIVGQRVFTGAGRGVDVEYQIVELSQLIPSQTDDGAANPAFPAELQPRDRSRATSAAQVQRILAEFEPERLGASADAATGAPLVGPDNVVESGNARTLALRRAYRESPQAARAYREFLQRQGFDASRYSEPVLIRRRRSTLTPDQRQALTVEAQKSGALDMGAAEVARIDAGRLDRILDLYRGGDVDLAGNREFVRAFARSLPDGEEGALFTAAGELSAAGKRRIESALLSRAYGDLAPDLVARLTEATDSDIKAIAGALQDAAGAWASMRAAAARGDINPAMDTTPDLLAAVRLVDMARQKGQPLHLMAEQGDMFGGGMTDLGRAWLLTMFRDGDLRRPLGRAPLAARVRGYLDEAMKSTPGTDMFGNPSVTPIEVLTLFEAEPGRNAARARRLDAATRPQPGADEASLLEAQRIAGSANPDVAVPSADAEGAYRLRPAADLLDEDATFAQQMANAASCLVRSAAE